MENKHRCRELGPAKMQKVYNGVDSNDWAAPLLPRVGLDEPFARAKGRFLRIMLGRLIVKDHVEKALVDVDAAVVSDKAEFAKATREEADPGSSLKCPSLSRDGVLQPLMRIPKVSQESLANMIGTISYAVVLGERFFSVFLA